MTFQECMNAATKAAQQEIEGAKVSSYFQRAEDARIWLDFAATNPASRLDVWKQFPNGFGSFNTYADMVVGKPFMIFKDFTKPMVNTNTYGIQGAHFLEVEGKWVRMNTDISHYHLCDCVALSAFDGSETKI